MQTLDYNDRYRITVGEMSRRSQLAVSTWFNDWFAGSGEQMQKLKAVSAISTQIILHSRLTLYRDGERLPDGIYELEDGVCFALPMTEAALNDLPASLVAWLIDAAGKENALVLETFLAGVQVVARRAKTIPARPFVSGPSGKSTAP